MRNPRIWDKKESLTLLDGKTYTPEEIFDHPDFPWSKVLTVFISDIEVGVVGEISPFENVRAAYRIDESLSNDEAIAKIRSMIKNPQASSSDDLPVTQSQIQLLGQLLTEINLNLMEGRIGV